MLFLILYLFVCQCLGQDDGSLIETEGAVAGFSRNGIDGTVKVINGHIILNLTFDSSVAWSQLGGASYCTTGGLYFGIYETWEYSDFSDKFGSSACSVEQTGSRWDPWLACSSISSNENCIYNDGCVPPSSEKWNADEYEYICNEWSYLTDPYICELGDLSGKYGLLEISQDSVSEDSYYIDETFSSAFEVDSYDLGGKSLIFRCHDNTRAFCAPFEEYKPTDDELTTYSRSFQETFYSSDENDDTSDNIYSMRAQFGDSGNSYVLLTYYNKYEIVLDSSDIDVPGGCGNEIYYRIFTEWDETGSDCEEKTSDRFWDPTIVCADNSENGDTNGKAYCEEDYYLCGDSTWSYECNNYFEDYTNRLLCAPGDLSAKYGSIDISDNVNFKINITGIDPKMPPMYKLKYKSVVLQCSEDKAIIDCAGFNEYYDDIGYKSINDLIDNEDTDNDESNKNKNGSNKNSFMGVSDTVILIMTILGIAAIVPCVKGCRNRRKGVATSAEDEFASNELDGVTGDGTYDEYANGNGSIRQHSQSRSRTFTGPNTGELNTNVNDHYRGRTIPSIQQAMAM